MSCLIIIHCLREITNRHISRIFSIILTKWSLSYFPLLLFMPIYVMCQASVPQFFRQCVAHINKICYFCSRNSKGEVLEWLKRHAWKACIRLKRIGGSNPPLSANRLQKDFTKVVILAFKIQIIVVKSRFYNDFSLYIPPLPDGITLCFGGHLSVNFCYTYCYTKIAAAKNVAVTGF